MITAILNRLLQQLGDALWWLFPPGEKSVSGFQILHVTHHFSVTPFLTRILDMELPFIYSRRRVLF
jgi:hypothetical protein